MVHKNLEERFQRACKELGGKFNGDIKELDISGCDIDGYKVFLDELAIAPGTYNEGTVTHADPIGINESQKFFNSKIEVDKTVGGEVKHGNDNFGVYIGTPIAYAPWQDINEPSRDEKRKIVKTFSKHGIPATTGNEIGTGPTEGIDIEADFSDYPFNNRDYINPEDVNDTSLVMKIE